MDRFWSKVNKNGALILDTPCWEWLGWLNTNRYGYFWINGKDVSAHRYSYEIKNGPIPKGLWILHKCDNPTCMNPDHLFVGTAKDNTQDMIKKGRKADTSVLPKAKGIGHGNAKLTDEQVHQIREEYPFVKSHRKLAKKFGVTKTVITNILGGIGWKHVPIRSIK